MESGLRERPEKGTLRRAALFDVAFPSDLVQYRSLNKMAILAIRVIATTMADFPVERVFVRQDGKKFVTVLPRARTDLSVEASGAGYVQDVFVLIPIRLLYSAGDLGIRLAGGAEEMRIGRLPIPFQPDFLKDFAADAEIENRAPAPEIVRAVLARAYCIKDS